jgi:hypothetical protein
MWGNFFFVRDDNKIHGFEPGLNFAPMGEDARPFFHLFSAPLFINPRPLKSNRCKYIYKFHTHYRYNFSPHSICSPIPSDQNATASLTHTLKRTSRATDGKSCERGPRAASPAWALPDTREKGS